MRGVMNPRRSGEEMSWPPLLNTLCFVSVDIMGAAMPLLTVMDSVPSNHRTKPSLSSAVSFDCYHGSAEVTNTTGFAHSLCKGESLLDWVFVHLTEAEHISGSILPWSSMWKPGHCGPARVTQRLLSAFTSLSLSPQFLYKNQLVNLVEMLPVSWSVWVLGINILRSAQRLHTHRSLSPVTTASDHPVQLGRG